MEGWVEGWVGMGGWVGGREGGWIWPSTPKFDTATLALTKNKLKKLTVRFIANLSI